MLENQRASLQRFSSTIEKKLKTVRALELESFLKKSGLSVAAHAAPIS